jgi:hypothetical protein
MVTVENFYLYKGQREGKTVWSLCALPNLVCDEKLVASRSTPKLERRSLSAVRDCIFSM